MYAYIQKVSLSVAAEVPSVYLKCRNQLEIIQHADSLSVPETSNKVHNSLYDNLCSMNL